MKRLPIIRLYCLFFLGLNISSIGHARHIVGGTMTYECLGDNNFNVKMFIYIDCRCTNCASFDLNANISIFSCEAGIDCSSLTQNTTVPNGNIKVGHSRGMLVTPPDMPCLIPPDLCVSETIYEFNTLDYDIDLIPNGNSYIISYQRCCRNDGINNLVQPSDGQGATFSIIIKPEALNVCNNSPVFRSFPPTVICNDVTFEYDHGANDIDGDSIVYYFCAPFVGGGADGGSPDGDCFSSRPDPSCPPNNLDGTYNTVSFEFPFSSDSPLPGTLTINERTGLISGMSNRVGRFVVGVCMDEYRDNFILSTSRRDFQFNIENCDPEVDARMNGDSLIDHRTYLYLVCNDLEVTFENLSVEREFIDDWLWKFDIGGQSLELTTWDATVNFPDTGFYSGMLIINTGPYACSDTAEILVYIDYEIVANFDYQYDTCRGFPIQFQNNSFSDWGPLSSFQWDFGDGHLSSLKNPNYLYDRPGTYNVVLTIEDTYGCIERSERMIDFAPVPLNVVVDPLPSGICAPVEVQFDNLSRPLDSTYMILWDFGDGQTSSNISPLHIYEEPGDYDVSVMIASPNGCEEDVLFEQFVSVIESAKAGFDYTPSEPKVDDPVVTFEELSQNAVAVSWDFYNQSSSSIRNPTHVFPDTGHYLVSQYAFHENGCIDTAQSVVFIRPHFSYFLPNAFTPNGDGANDIYVGVGKLIGIQNFELSIWNRWGEQVFVTTDSNEGWNGRKHNLGILLQPGIYVCYVRFVDSEGVLQEIKSFVTVIQ